MPHKSLRKGLHGGTKLGSVGFHYVIRVSIYSNIGSKMKTLWTLIVVLLNLGSPIPVRAANYQHPGGFHTFEQINDTRSQIAAGAQPWTSAYKVLVTEADRVMSQAPSAPGNISSCDNCGNMWYTLRGPLDGDSSAAYVTALAYTLGAGDQYGRKAIGFLNNWSHTNRSIGGGSDAYLNTAESISPMIAAAELMYHSPLWSRADREQFKYWLVNIIYPACYAISRPTTGPEYRFWPAGMNWGLWGIVCNLSINHFADDAVNMANDIEQLKWMIDFQIEPDGALRSELNRGDRSRYYSFFALKAMTGAVEIARNSGVNLYHYVPPSGGNLKQALDWYWNHTVANPNSWPIPVALRDFFPDPAQDGGIFFFPMSIVYDEPEWKNWVGKNIVTSFGGNTSWIMPSLVQPVPRGSAVSATLPAIGDGPGTMPPNTH